MVTCYETTDSLGQAMLGNAELGDPPDVSYLGFHSWFILTRSIPKRHILERNNVGCVWTLGLPVVWLVDLSKLSVCRREWPLSSDCGFTG
jgi:hypothetical protein